MKDTTPFQGFIFPFINNSQFSHRVFPVDISEYTNYVQWREGVRDVSYSAGLKVDKPLKTSKPMEPPRVCPKTG